MYYQKKAWRYVVKAENEASPITYYGNNENTNAHAQESSGPRQLSLPVNFYLDFFVFVGNAVGFTTISFITGRNLHISIICLQI